MKLTGTWQRLHQLSPFGAKALLTGTTNVVIGMLGIFSGAFVARLLGPKGRGELAAIQTWPTLFGYLVMLGTDQAVVYYSAREPDRAGRFVGTAASISVLVSIPSIVGIYLVMPLLLSAQSPPVIAAARWYLAIVPVVALTYLGLHVLRGRSDFVFWNVLRTTPTFAWFAVLALAWLSAQRAPRFVAGAYLVALAATALPTALVLRKRVPGSFLPEGRTFGPLLRYGLPCVTSSLPLVVNLRLDQMLMAALLFPTALGFYVVAVAWSGAINPMMNAIGSVLFPSIAAHAHDADRLGSFSRGSRFAALLALITVPILAAITPWGLVLLFGRRFQAAVPAALILVPAGAVAALNSVIEEGFRGLGRPTVVMRAEFTGAIMTAVALYLLLRPLGIVGASIASMLGYSTVMVVLLIHARWATGTSIVSLMVPNLSDLRAVARLAQHAKSVFVVAR